MWNNGVRIYNDAYRYIVDHMIGVLGLDADGEIFENLEHKSIEERSWI
jgi:cytochrome oxidase Cu insertion factor (SCO1/SenC/PrrC family)